MTDWREQVRDYADRLSKRVQWDLPPQAEEEARAASEAMRRLLGRLGALEQIEIQMDRAIAEAAEQEAQRHLRARVAERDAAWGQVSALLDDLRTLLARLARAEVRGAEGDR